MEENIQRSTWRIEQPVGCTFDPLLGSTMSPLRATFSFFAVEGSHECTFDGDGRRHRQRNALKSAIAIYGCHLAWITRECSERVPMCRVAISWTTQICTACIHKGLRQLRQKLATLYLVESYFRLRFHFKASSLMESDKGLGNVRSSETRFQWLLSIKDCLIYLLLED